MAKNKKRKNNKSFKHNDNLDKSIEVENTEMDEVNKTLSDDNESEVISNKREHADNDSDTEDQPKKKKKKKKQQQAVESTEKKGKKSIRQLKREKHAQRQAEASAVAKDELKSQCLTYLSQWKHDRSNWKFMKAKQIWLFKNKFSPSLVPDSAWSILLEYFESAQGNIRNMLLEDSNKVMSQMDTWTEEQEKEVQNNGDKEDTNEDDEKETDESSAAPEIIKPDETSYKRARDLIQCLQE